MKTTDSNSTGQMRAIFAQPIPGPFLVLLILALGQGGAMTATGSAPGSEQPPPLSAAANASPSLMAVAHGNGFWVAASEGALWVSADGAQWASLGSVPSGLVRDVAFDGRLFVAVGDAGLILTSTDAVNWTRRESPATHTLRAITPACTGFLAAGSSGTIIRSPDGLEWSQRVSGVSDELRGVCFSQGRFVAVGSRRTLLVSMDGHRWAQAMPRSSVGLKAVAAGPDGFVAVGCGDILTSPDGWHWQRSTLCGGQDSILDVTWGGGVWVAVGKAGRILASTNGQDWVEPERVTRAQLNWVHFAQGHFIAAGKNGVLLRSNNGLEWEWVPDPFIILEAKRPILVSRDGR